MSNFTQMNFVPPTGLNDTTAYPTKPSSEANIRAAIQGISDQLKNYIDNVLLAELMASDTSGSSGSDKVGSAAITGVDGLNIRAQIQSLKTQLTSANAANLTNGVVQTIHLADNAVTAPKIATGAVTVDKILNGSINSDKLSATLKPTTANIDYYVNADTGNDSTGDGSSGNPYKTVAKVKSIALQNIGYGYKTRIFYTGTSTEDVILDFIGNGEVDLLGVGSTHTIGSVINISTCYSKISNLTLTTSIALYGSFTTSILIGTSANCSIDTCISIASVSYGIGICVYGKATITGCTISNKYSAIRVDHSGFATSRSNSGTNISDFCFDVLSGIIIKVDETQPVGIGGNFTTYVNNGRILS